MLLLVQLFVRSFFPRQDCQTRLTFRRAVAVGLFGFVFLPLQVVNRLAILLDHLFFRFREIDPAGPLFIVGVPRSGTTFLHRLLALDTQQFTTFRLWELIFAPSILQKYFFLALARADATIGRPLARLVRMIERAACRHLDEMHETSLNDPEEDYLLLLPAAACFLLIQPFPFSKQIWDLASFDRQADAARRRRVMGFYVSLVKRHLYVFGASKRLLSKNPSFTPMLRSLQEAFPEAQFVACIRDPQAVVPSQLSAMESGARLFGNAGNSEFQRRLIEMLKSYYHLLLEDYADWPAESFQLLGFQQLVKNPVECVGRLYDRLDLGKNSDFDGKLEKERSKSKNYKSRHRYSIEQFGLTTEDISRDFEFALSGDMSAMS